MAQRAVVDIRSVPFPPVSIPVLSGLAPLAARYDAFILDLWGVIHDGIAPYPGVLDGLGRLRAAGKRVVLLSNAPRRSAKVAAELGRMGIDDALYDAVLTSGEATRIALTRRDDAAFAALGRRYLFIGKDGDRDLLDGLDYRSVDDVAEADFLLDTGLGLGPEGPLGVADYADPLAAARARALPMVCANPDLAVIRGGRREACAGALAQHYAGLGGAVLYRGKPYPEIYRLCRTLLDGASTGRVLAVGDGLATDIVGARDAGIDALLVTGGLLADAWGVDPAAPPDPARVAAACAEAGVAPIAAIAALTW